MPHFGTRVGREVFMVASLLTASLTQESQYQAASAYEAAPAVEHTLEVQPEVLNFDVPIPVSAELGATALSQEATVVAPAPEQRPTLTPFFPLHQRELGVVALRRQLPTVEKIEKPAVIEAPKPPATPLPALLTEQDLGYIKEQLRLVEIDQAVSRLVIPVYGIEPVITQEVAKHLLINGYTLACMSATVGALMQESRLDPAINDDGMVQWTGGRKIRVNPQKTDTRIEQLNKMIKEKQESYSRVYEGMQTETSLSRCNSLMQVYEGAGILGPRAVYASQVHRQLVDGVEYTYLV